MDDVLLDFFGGVLTALYTEYNLVVPWNGDPWGDDAVSAAFDLPIWKESGYDDWWGWLRERDWLWGSVFQAVPGAIGGIKTLRERGHQVELVTAKPTWAEPQVWRWLGKWRPAVQRVTIVPIGVSKAEVTDADIIIDDKLATIHDWVDSEDDRLGIWFARHEASGALPPERAVRVRDWAGVLETVSLMEETA
jgi:hypothetical protein